MKQTKSWLQGPVFVTQYKGSYYSLETPGSFSCHIYIYIHDHPCEPMKLLPGALNYLNTLQTIRLGRWSG